MASSIFGPTGAAAETGINPQIAQLAALLKNSQNPNAMIQQMMSSNPEYASVMEIIKKYGNDPKTAFFEEAKNRGVDPNQVLAQLKQLGLG